MTPATAGTGYQVEDNVTATLPGADVVTPAIGEAQTVSVSGGTGITDQGDTTVTISASQGVTSAGNDGSGAEFDVTVASGEVTSVTVSDGGSGYKQNDSVSFDPTVVFQDATDGTNFTIFIDSIDEETTAAGPDVTIIAQVETIS